MRQDQDGKSHRVNSSTRDHSGTFTILTGRAVMVQGMQLEAKIQDLPLYLVGLLYTNCYFFSSFERSGYY